MAEASGLPAGGGRRRWRSLGLALVTPVLLAGLLVGWIHWPEHSFTLPPIAEPTPMPAGYALRVAAARQFDENPYSKASTTQTHRPDDPADDPLLPVMRETAAKNEAALARMRAALDVPCWVSASGYDSTGNAKLRSAARVMAMTARLRQAEGDRRGAASLLLDTMRLGQDLSRGRSFAGALSADIVSDTGADPLWQLAPRLAADEVRAVTAELLRVLEREASARQRLDWTAPVTANWEAVPRRWPEDRYAAYRRAVEGAESSVRPTIGVYRLQGTRARVATLVDWLSLVAAPAPIERHRQLTSYLADLAVELDRPYDQQRLPPLTGRRWVGSRDNATFEWRYRHRWPARQAGLRLLLVDLAARSYRAEHGAYPERLDALVPRYLRAVPDDPFTAAKLHYRRDGEGYLCWSVGPDGRDDGGRRIGKDGHDSPARGVVVDADSVGDIVAP